MKFTKKESFGHKSAIEVLKSWIESRPQLLGYNYNLTVKIETEFKINGIISFVPDLVIYDDDKIIKFIEVANSSFMTGIKLCKIQYYQYLHKTNIDVIEINSDWILRQIHVPYNLEYTLFKGIYHIK